METFYDNYVFIDISSDSDLTAQRQVSHQFRNDQVEPITAEIIIRASDKIEDRRKNIMERFRFLSESIPNGFDKTISLLKLHYEHESIIKGVTTDEILLHLPTAIHELKQQLEDITLQDRSAKCYFEKFEKLSKSQSEAERSRAPAALHRLAEEVRPVDLDLMLELINRTKLVTSGLRDQRIVLLLGETGRAHRTANTKYVHLCAIQNPPTDF